MLKDELIKENGFRIQRPVRYMMWWRRPTSISGRKSQTTRSKAKGETHTMNSTAMPINILVSATSWGEIDDSDDDERPFAEEISARHAAASRIFIAVIIVAVVTMIIITPGMPAPYTKLWR